MSDTYQTIANSPMGKALFGAINLPIPVILERWQPGQASFIKGRVLVGAANGSTGIDSVLSTLKGAPDAQVAVLANTSNATDLQKKAGKLGVDADNYTANRDDDAIQRPGIRRHRHPEPGRTESPVGLLPPGDSQAG